MAQYMISVWHDGEYEVDFSSEENQRLATQVGTFNEQLMADGQWVSGCGLMPASTAVVVHPDASLTDGPYSPADQQMGGFWIVEAADDDAARGLAGRAAAACEGAVELRPLQG